jgi:guanylate kinase
VLIIFGRSCSGKDRITEELIKLGYTRLITSTTRPMRQNEMQDITYHYLPITEFLNKYNNDYFLEVKYYNTPFGLWYYGSSKEDIDKADENTVCILTPDGVKKVKESGKKYVGILINVSDETIKSRQELRGDNSTEEKKAEAKRRFLSDKEDFENIDGLIDFTINNENKSPKDAAMEIDKLYRERMNTNVNTR